jgi:SAM-dependent methyltransferase
MTFYGEDLAYIHDAGHSGYALGAAPGLLRFLRRHGVRDGLVIDLGCGSGRWAAELNRGGYDVVGIDRSKDLLKLARRHAPESRFVRGSLWTAKLTRCDAVTSIGECINYDGGSTLRLFLRIRDALRPGGVFLFDAAGPERTAAGGPRRYWNQGRDWAALAETESNRARTTLTRKIIAFRKIGGSYRRSEEVHHLRLYRPEDLVSQLEKAGLRAEAVNRWGRFRLPDGVTGFAAIRS